MSLAPRRYPEYADMTDAEVIAYTKAQQKRMRELYGELDALDMGDEANAVMCEMDEVNAVLANLDDELCARDLDWPQ